MAATNYTPISLYYSSTATNVPLAANLANGELGLNIADMKLYAKNSSGVVTLLASNSGASATVSSVAVSGGTTGLTTSGGPITTSGTITLAGTLIAANGGTGFASYTTGDMLYASGATTISKLSLGTTNYVLTAGASGPQYVAQSTLAAGSATTATNLSGGIANQIPYQTGAGATSFITAPSTAGYVLGWTGSAFSWVNAPAATSATNLSGGSAGVVPYQTGSGATSFTAVGTSGQALISAGTGTPAFGTLGISGGGTNSTATATAGGIAYGTGTAFAFTVAGTAGQVLTSNGAGAPTWSAGGSNAYTRTAYTATSGQTSFAVTYTVGYVEVYLNGVLLTASDYTATNGTTVVLTIGATLNDIVEFIAFNTTPISNTTANNLLAGTAGQVIYQSAPNTTAFSGPGTTGQALISNASSGPTFGTLGIAGGGTGLTSTPANGALDIGNGTGFTRTTLTAGTGITVTNAAGSITISGSPVVASPLTLSASANLTMAISSSQSAYITSKIITLDANRELVIYNTFLLSDTISAFVYNSSTNTFGAAATIRATASVMGAVLVSTDKVLVVSMGSSGTTLEAVTLSISTNTITVNTAATATLAGVLAGLSGTGYYGSFVTVGTSFVLSYGRATNVTALRAFTVSGTTVTIGSESTLTPATDNAAALFSISSSVVLALSSSATVFYATPYTVSGTTLTVGTGATTTLTGQFYIPAGVFQSGQIGVLFFNGTIFGGIISVSGTTATISSTQVWSSGAALTANNNYTAIIGDKMLCYYSAATNLSLVNVLTNTSGTASAGTEIAGGSASNATSQLGYINGTILSFGLNIPLKYSISGSNAIETIVDTYYAQASASTFDLLNNLGTRIWTGSSYISPFILRSATKTLAPFAANSVYMNSDGTLTPTVAKVFGNSTSIIGNETNVCWFINYRSATTVTALKVTLS